MKTALLVALMLALALISGCTSQSKENGPSAGPVPQGSADSQASGSDGFTLESGRPLETGAANETSPSTAGTGPQAQKNATQNTTGPVTGGDGGQIVDVGGSIGIQPG